jgi:hypothetical protein
MAVHDVNQQKGHIFHNSLSTRLRAAHVYTKMEKPWRKGGGVGTELTRRN